MPPLGAALAASSTLFPSTPTPPPGHLPVRFAMFASLASYSAPSHLFLWSRPPPPPLPLVAEAIVRADASHWRTRVTASSSGGGGLEGSAARDIPGQLGLDELLSIAEVVCVAPPIIYSTGCLASFLVPGVPKQFQLTLGSKLFAMQYFLLVGAVAIGSLIRWRQWQRICRVNEDAVDVDLIGRIEKVEEDLRSSATIVRVLSRQLEKLGIRFRVTRKTLKEPITETKALAQKNSEATHALAIQEDILEKELGEIQKVLLAMQEQQQKQLELIIAIVKAGGLLDSKRDSLLEHGRVSLSNIQFQKAKK